MSLNYTENPSYYSVLLKRYPFSLLIDKDLVLIFTCLLLVWNEIENVESPKLHAAVSSSSPFSAPWQGDLILLSYGLLQVRKPLGKRSR